MLKDLKMLFRYALNVQGETVLVSYLFMIIASVYIVAGTIIFGGLSFWIAHMFNVDLLHTSIAFFESFGLSTDASAKVVIHVIGLLTSPIYFFIISFLVRKVRSK